MPALQPTIMAGVPRVFNRIYDKVTCSATNAQQANAQQPIVDQQHGGGGALKRWELWGGANRLDVTSGAECLIVGSRSCKGLRPRGRSRGPSSGRDSAQTSAPWRGGDAQRSTPVLLAHFLQEHALEIFFVGKINHEFGGEVAMRAMTRRCGMRSSSASSRLCSGGRSRSS